MAYDYSKLNGLISEKFSTNAEFASRMSISERSMSLKINGKVGWKQKEITKACELLGIEERQIALYFFKLKVQVS